jgi:hypothetical protein
MKKFLLKFSMVAILIATLSSCDEDKVIFKGEGTGTLAAFATDKGALPAVDDSTTSTVVVNVANATSSDRTIVISIDPSSTAVPAEYQILSNTLFIPANEYQGKIIIKSNFNVLQKGVTKELVLKLDSVEDATVFPGKFTLKIFKFCAFVREDFLGQWTATETGKPSYLATFTAGVKPNEILISNVWNYSSSSVTRVFFNDSDPANFVLDFPPYLQNVLSQSINTYGVGWVDKGSGTFSACEKTVNMKFTIRVGAGTFAPSTVLYTKQ